MLLDEGRDPCGTWQGGGVLIKNRARFIEFFSQKLSFWPEASSLRVRDVKKQVVWTHTSRKHNLQHPCAPKSAIFHQKSAKNGHFLSKIVFFGQKIPFFSPNQCVLCPGGQLVLLIPYCEGVGLKGRGVACH